jgi:L-alanine-DL-glutamate epimerase-like enolase superfamily enzyme
VKLKFRRLDLQLVDPWTIARARETTLIAVVDVELTDGDGFIGLGEASPAARYNESVEKVEAFLAKLDANRLCVNDIDSNISYLRAISPGSMAAKCAIDIALIDAAAKRAKQPVYDFLGLGFRDQHHVTSFTIGIDTPEVIRRKVLAAAQYPILKMKVGVPEDKANLRALRDVAPSKVVRVDANEGWATKEQALAMIEWLATDGRIQFVEQPMPASVLAKDWVWLKQRSPLPIFADESYHLAEDAERVAGCFHGVNVKLVKAGGITPAVEALRAARKLGLQTMLGCMIETSLLTSAAAHLAELCDYLDLDGNLLIKNNPYAGVTADKGILSFTHAPERYGLRASAEGNSPVGTPRLLVSG